MFGHTLNSRECEGEMDQCHMHSGSCLVTHVPSRGWGRRISAMFVVGDTQSHMSQGGMRRRGYMPKTLS